MNTNVTNDTIKIELPDKVDSNSAPAFEEELLNIQIPDGVQKIVLDAKGMKYISSAGLRVILKFSKKVSLPIVIDDVAHDVYEIFNATGFTEMFTINKALRFVDIEGLEPLGRGVSGTVYRLNDEQVVKVFHRNLSREILERIIHNIRAAIVQGIPTILPFEVVTTKDGIGFITERVANNEIAKKMHDNPEMIPFYAERMVAVLKKLAAAEMKPGELKKYEQRLIVDLEGLEVLISKEDIALVKQFIEAVPERYSAVHGDFQGCNVIEQGDEFILIDMDDLGYGHPVWDATQLIPVYKICPTKPDQIKVIFDLPPEAPYDPFFSKIFRMTREEATKCFDCFVDKYFEGMSEDRKEKCLKLMSIYNNVLFVRFINLNIRGKELTPQQITAKREVIMEYVNNLKQQDIAEIPELFEAWPL
ncbi:TIGR02172 family protein [Oribacterium sp. KHPX15]|uniref:STAS domain-containing protein n=1 Tax=Oribacterium sp. KHPX15 TaxID=1855342 RepID=UPI00089C01B3|nr:STAS domain-containing protein [Oribacterium sp. KHPX15]SDZ98515.1 TIGR02172 family protein [Oribacterium sp. KHPX15]